MQIIPTTREMLHYTGIFDDAEMCEFLDLWPGRLAVLDDGKPLGVVSTRSHNTEPMLGIGNVWITPEKRGHWMNKSNLQTFCKYIFTYHPAYVAYATETRCDRLYRRLGFKKYCQKDDVSYYLLTKEKALNGTLHT